MTETVNSHRLGFTSLLTHHLGWEKPCGTKLQDWDNFRESTLQVNESWESSAISIFSNFLTHRPPPVPWRFLRAQRRERQGSESRCFASSCNPFLKSSQKKSTNQKMASKSCRSSTSPQFVRAMLSLPLLFSSSSSSFSTTSTSSSSTTSFSSPFSSSRGSSLLTVSLLADLLRRDSVSSAFLISSLSGLSEQRMSWEELYTDKSGQASDMVQNGPKWSKFFLCNYKPKISERSFFGTPCTVLLIE